MSDEERHIHMLEGSLADAEQEIADLKAERDELRKALQPFANFACDPPCECHNCIARRALKQETK